MVQPINPGGNPLIFIPDSFNLPDVSKLSYDESKRFFGMVFQQNKPWFDFDINEFSNELNYWIIKTAQGIFGTDNNNAYRMIGSDSSKSLQPLESTTNTNNLKFKSGTVFQGGRFIDVPADLEYNDDTVNYICLGQVTTITEIVPALRYTIQDSEKLFNIGYQLESCRIKFLSGNLSGSTFDIENIDGYNFIVSGDLSTVVLGDTYRILPPELKTPTADSTVDTIYFVSWFEDISPKENRVLENPTQLDAYNTTVNASLDDPIWGTDHPSHRKQLRWCLFANRNQVVTTDVTGIQVGTSHLSTSICSIQRDTGDSSILQASITDVENYYYSLSKSFDLLKNVDGSLNENTLSFSNLYVDTIYALSGNTITVSAGGIGFGNVVNGYLNITTNTMLKVNKISESAENEGIRFYDDVIFNENVSLSSITSTSGAFEFTSPIKVDTISEYTTANGIVFSDRADFSDGLDCSSTGVFNNGVLVNGGKLQTNIITDLADGFGPVTIEQPLELAGSLSSTGVGSYITGFQGLTIQTINVTNLNNNSDFDTNINVNSPTIFDDVVTIDNDLQFTGGGGILGAQGITCTNVTATSIQPNLSNGTAVNINGPANFSNDIDVTGNVISSGSSTSDTTVTSTITARLSNSPVIQVTSPTVFTSSITSQNTVEYFAHVDYQSGTNTYTLAPNSVGFSSVAVAAQTNPSVEYARLEFSRQLNAFTISTICVEITPVQAFGADVEITSNYRLFTTQGVNYIDISFKHNNAYNRYSFSIMIKDLG